MIHVDVGVLGVVLSMEDDEGGKRQRGTDGDVIANIIVPEGNPMTKEQHCGLWNGRVYRGVYAGKEGAVPMSMTTQTTLSHCVGILDFA
jgi:hypothetical protein